MDPKKGIEFLVEHGLLNHNEADVAAFLYKGEGLNKTAIGDYLGERNDFNERVLREFVSLHDFTDLILVQALRYAVLFNVHILYMYKIINIKLNCNFYLMSHIIFTIKGSDQKTFYITLFWIFFFHKIL